MTDSLQRAFAEISQLSDSDQDAIAAWLLGELSSERKWDELFKNSQGTLSMLAKEAILEYASGATKAWGES